MEIRKVQSTKDVAAFHAVPQGIYSAYPHWVPHLKQDVEKVFDPKQNKAWRHGKAERWIAWRDGQAIGRVSAFLNDKYSKGMEQPTGGLGFFECYPDAIAARALMETAQQWLEGAGMEAMDGPINFGEKNMFWGLLTENFTDLGSYGMNFNPEYYVDFFRDFGFKMYYEQFCYKRDMYEPAQEVFVEKAERVRRDPDFKFTNVRGMKPDEIGRAFTAVYNAAWGGHHGFKAMNEAQGQKMVKALKPVMDHDIIVFGWHKEKPIAFYVNIPELNQIFNRVNGNLNAIGKVKFLYHKWRKTPTTMVGLVFGVDRSYHGRGIEGALIKWTEENIVSLKRYDETILTWIGDFNPKMIKVAENLGAERYRTLQTMRKLFDPDQPFVRAPMVQ